MRKEKRDNIAELLTDEDYSYKQFGDLYNQWNVEENYTKDKMEKVDVEQEYLEEVEATDKDYYGRMSPFVKETIYKEYQAGMSIKDLSLKYGCL